MRFLGFFVALALVLLAATFAGDSTASLFPIARETSKPAETFTIAQSTTVVGWRITLSLNSIRLNPVSACEFSTPSPGTHRMSADVALTPVGSPGFIVSSQILGLVDTGDYRYSLRLPDYGPGGSRLPGSLLSGRSGRGSIVSDVTDTPGMKYSLELVSNGLWGRVVYDSQVSAPDTRN